jgi:hypothetical protein
LKNNFITPLFAAASLILIASCGAEEEPVATESTETTEVEVPTQDEADAAAAESITEENADEELEKLLDDIDG